MKTSLPQQQQLQQQQQQQQQHEDSLKTPFSQWDKISTFCHVHAFPHFTIAAAAYNSSSRVSTKLLQHWTDMANIPYETLQRCQVSDQTDCGSESTYPTLLFPPSSTNFLQFCWLLDSFQVT